MTVEQRLRLALALLGERELDIAVLTAQLEAARKRIAELEPPPQKAN